MYGWNGFKEKQPQNINLWLFLKKPLYVIHVFYNIIFSTL